MGVRQGDVLSPNIFKIFINDLPAILDSQSLSVTLSNKNIPCLLYADDLVLISDTKEGLQQKLNILYDYCNNWCLEINTSKTKTIIFNKNGRLMKDTFSIGPETIESVKFYKYLGIILTISGKFTEARKNLYGKSI